MRKLFTDIMLSSKSKILNLKIYFNLETNSSLRGVTLDGKYAT